MESLFFVKRDMVPFRVTFFLHTIHIPFVR